MLWTASIRHGVREVPAGLALVQDLLQFPVHQVVEPESSDAAERRPPPCHNADGQLAFDSSGGSTTIWHDPSTCGDTAGRCVQVVTAPANDIRSPQCRLGEGMTKGQRSWR